MKFPEVLILTTGHKQKSAWVEQTRQSIDDRGHYFGTKILAIDEFDGHVFEENRIAPFKHSGWMVFKDSHKSRSLSMFHGTMPVGSEWVFYSEDDVVIDLPLDFDMGRILNCGFFDKKMPGMISLTFGGTAHDLSVGNIGDLALIRQNLIYQDDNLVYFKREESMRDPWFFEFPGLFIRKNLLFAVLNHARNHYAGLQIEQALTLSWFDLQIDKAYFKASILRREVENYLFSDPMRLIKEGRFMTLLDPNQGHFIYGGNPNA